VYKGCQDKVLYVGDILIIENDIETLSIVTIWLSNQFDMDVGEVGCILEIKLLRDRIIVCRAYPRLHTLTCKTLRITFLRVLSSSS
jgi:hypothetical protein